MATAGETAVGWRRVMLVALGPVVAITVHRLFMMGSGRPVEASTWPVTLLVALVVGVVGGLVHEGLRPSPARGGVGHEFLSWFVPLFLFLGLLALARTVDYELGRVYDAPAWFLVRPLLQASVLAAVLTLVRRRPTS